MLKVDNLLDKLLAEANAKGLDIFKVIQAAASLDALHSGQIDEKRLPEIFSSLEKKAEPARPLEQMIAAPVEQPAPQPAVPDLHTDPIYTAIDVAKGSEMPVSPIEWDNRKPHYEKHLGKALPTSEEIIAAYGTWEVFWAQMGGFHIGVYSAGEIIDLSLQIHPKGHLSKKEFDARFPDIPSSSEVLRVFGEWEHYAEGVEREMHAQKAPDRMIAAMLAEGLSVKDVEKAIVTEFRGRRDIPIIYTRQSNPLYMLISEKKKKLEGELEKGALSREEIMLKHPTLELIATEQIKEFKLYNGERKQETRMQMAEDIVDLLVKQGEDNSFSYLGLESVNFRSYIFLQQQLENAIDPGRTVVAEYDHGCIQAMRTIMQNHDAIEGGEIFEGLQLKEGFLHDILVDETQRFDILNLDYMGGWSMSKVAATERLFDRGLIADDALIYITLLNSEMEKANVKEGNTSRGILRKGFGTDDQRKLVEKQMERLCKTHRYELEQLRCEEYFDTQKMLFIAYHVKRK